MELVGVIRRVLPASSSSDGGGVKAYGVRSMEYRCLDEFVQMLPAEARIDVYKVLGSSMILRNRSR